MKQVTLVIAAVFLAGCGTGMRKTAVTGACPSCPGIAAAPTAPPMTLLAAKDVPVFTDNEDKQLLLKAAALNMKYFDTLKKAWLRKFLDRRVRDGVIRRLIDKWLQAGVWEKGQVSYPEDGTPQGGVIWPLLSNVYLHEVLDCWFVEESCRG